jgi:anti-anti-sigma factor
LDLWGRIGPEPGEETTVCQYPCHDTHDASAEPAVVVPDETVTQRHDEYGPAPHAVDAGGHDCRIVHAERGPVRVVQVIGRLDWVTGGSLRDFMRDDCLDPAVIVDLSAAAFDSAGNGDLLAAASRAKSRGQQLVVIAADRSQLEVLSVTGLGLVVPIVLSEEEAMGWLQARGLLAEAGI